MPKQNFKSHAKRKRELAKLDKRQAKDQKRALQRAQQSDAGVAVAAVTPVAPPPGARVAPAVTQKPLTLAEAVERWKNTRIVKAKTR
ncbi:MAG: hypothetical protein EHM50_02135 [Lysobacterales bacterium]|nr:MAG: hypothetical protein EHM50_02135 [Xanthomonadales bacterium]